MEFDYQNELKEHIDSIEVSSKLDFVIHSGVEQAKREQKSQKKNLIKMAGIAASFVIIFVGAKATIPENNITNPDSSPQDAGLMRSATGNRSDETSGNFEEGDQIRDGNTPQIASAQFSVVSAFSSGEYVINLPIATSDPKVLQEQAEKCLDDFGKTFTVIESGDSSILQLAVSIETEEEYSMIYIKMHELSLEVSLIENPDVAE